jgi:NADH-quinone oxidoreductase subunit N
MSLMASATDLVMLYVAMETTSISAYVLVGFLRDDDKSAEAGIKYLLFGAFASAVMLYGLSLLYGYTGTTNIYDIAQLIQLVGVSEDAVIVAAVLILVGFSFKIAAVPFHFWTPDLPCCYASLWPGRRVSSIRAMNGCPC